MNQTKGYTTMGRDQLAQINRRLDTVDETACTECAQLRAENGRLHDQIECLSTQYHALEQRFEAALAGSPLPPPGDCQCPVADDEWDEWDGDTGELPEEITSWTREEREDEISAHLADTAKERNL